MSDPRQALATIRERLEKATPLEDTGHSQVCACKGCEAVWERGAAFQSYSKRAINEDMPRLLGVAEAALELLPWACPMDPVGRYHGEAYEALQEALARLEE